MSAAIDIPTAVRSVVANYQRRAPWFEACELQQQAAQAREAYITAHPELMARSNFTERRETT